MSHKISEPMELDSNEVFPIFNAFYMVIAACGGFASVYGISTIIFYSNLSDLIAGTGIFLGGGAIAYVSWKYCVETD